MPGRPLVRCRPNSTIVNQVRLGVHGAETGTTQSRGYYCQAPAPTAAGGQHENDMQMIRKVSTKHAAYSVAQQDDTTRVFVAAEPESGDDTRRQTLDALRTIRSIMRDEASLGAVVQQTVFLHSADDLAACRETIETFYGDQLPATTYIHQSPCSQKLVSIEAIGVGREAGDLTVERHSGRAVVTRYAGLAWAHVANVQPDTTAAGTYQRACSMFHQATETLAECGFHYGQIIRTWLYLGDIVGQEEGVQRYFELNRARADFHAGVSFAAGLSTTAGGGPGFPGSTGIGMGGRAMVMSGIALATARDDVRVVPLENPSQTSAFSYGRRYGPESPQFARGLTVVHGDCALTFISGTASITGSETRFVGDVHGQTEQTLDNIAALISPDNMRRHGMPGLGATLDDLAVARVYVKYAEDAQAVQTVCRARMGQLPMNCAVADVCRPELLVEVEGIAFSRHP